MTDTLEDYLPDGDSTLADRLSQHGPGPVAPVGHRDGLFWLFDVAGQLRGLSARDLRHDGQVAIFGGDMRWPWTVFPRFDGRSGAQVGWHDQHLQQHLIRECRKRGLFDGTRPVRGVGVWRGADGGLVLHAGDGLRIEGAWRPAGCEIQGALYPAAPRVARPAAQAGGLALASDLLADLRLWRFELGDIGPEIALGYIAVAFLGQWAEWRVHVMPLGRRGSGKSWLSALVAAALGAGAHAALNDYTEAGLRQSLTGEARALILDEAEGDEQSGHRIAAVVNLLRRMSGGAGAVAVRGSAGGRASHFSVAGSVWLAAILDSTLKPQDRSRITVLRLRPLPKGEGAAERAERAMGAIERWGRDSAALRARALDGAGRFKAMLRLYKAALLRLNCDGRQADQLGSLIAGKQMLLSDDLPSEAEALAEVSRFAVLIADVQADDSHGEGEECLTFLLSSPVDLWRSGQRQTVAELIIQACDMSDATGRMAAAQTLGTIGLKVVGWAEPGKARVLVAHQHRGLDRLFQGTRWEGSARRTALGYLPGVSAWRQPERFAGVQSRCLCLPPALMPRPDDQHAQAPPDEPGERAEDDPGGGGAEGG